MEWLFWLILGAFVGWNLPQPAWAKVVQHKLLDFFHRPK